MHQTRFITKALHVLILFSLAAAAGVAPLQTAQAAPPAPTRLLNVEYNINGVNSLAMFQGKLYFAASENNGLELYQTDGTPAGTNLLMDINPGDASSLRTFMQSRFAVSGANLFFSASDGAHGEELWATGGTPGATRLVRDILPGANGSQPFQLTDLDGLLYFLVNEPGGAVSLWRSNGTEAGTELVTGFPDAGTPASIFTLLVSFQHQLMVFLDTGNTVQIWRYNPAGSTLDRIAIWEWHGINQAVVFDNQVYFSLGSNSGEFLYRTDGTTSGTVPVPGSLTRPSSMTPAGQRMFFVALQNGTAGLYQVGTGAATPQLVRAFGPGEYPHFFNVGDMVAVGENIFFSLQSVNNTGAVDLGVLWKSDGTPAGTFPIRSNEGEYDMDFLNTGRADLTVIGSRVFFAARRQVYDWEGYFYVWSSDGTTRGTHREIDPTRNWIGVNPTGLWNLNGRLFTGLRYWGDYSDVWVYDPDSNDVLAYPDIRLYPSENSVTVIDVLSNDQHLHGGQVLLASFDATSDHSGKVTRYDNGTPADLTDDKLIYTAPGGYTGTDTFYYTVEDGQGASDSTYVRLDVNLPENAIGDVRLTNQTVLENAPAGTEVGQLQVIYPAGGNQASCTFSYPENAPFALQGSRLVTTRPLDFESEPRYKIVFDCLDSSQAGMSKSFSIFTADLNDGPSVMLSNDVIPENSPAGSRIGYLTVVGASQPFQGSCALSDSAGGHFRLDNWTLYEELPLDHEAQASYTLRVDCQPAVGDPIQDDVVVYASDVNEPHTLLEASPVSVTMDQNSSPTPFQLTLHAADPDAKLFLNYTWSATPPTHGSASVETQGPNSLTASIHYTPYPNYTGPDQFKVRLSDGRYQAEVTVQVTVRATNLNGPPVLVETSPQPVTMNQNGWPTPFQLTLHAVDPDNDTLIWGTSVPEHGFAAVEPHGMGETCVIHYTPQSGYHGTDVFSVWVKDGAHQASLTVQVAIQTVEEDQQDHVYLPVLIRP